MEEFRTSTSMAAGLTFGLVDEAVGVSARLF